MQPKSIYTLVRWVQILKATKILLNQGGKRIILGQSYSRWKKGISSVRELPTVGYFLANVFKDFGLLNFLGFLVAKSTTTSSLSLLAFVAVDVWRQTLRKSSKKDNELQSNISTEKKSAWTLLSLHNPILNNENVGTEAYAIHFQKIRSGHVTVDLN